jgi:predicted Zn-ribbon and HTH transcriptional regulator
MATIGEIYICDTCGFVFMIVGNPKRIKLNPTKCPQDKCNGKMSKATIGWQ